MKWFNGVSSVYWQTHYLTVSLSPLVANDQSKLVAPT
jgi:hypothetical protein